MEKTNIRQKLLNLLSDYWWALLIIFVILAFTVDIPIFRWILGSVLIIVVIIFALPFFFALLSSLFMAIIAFSLLIYGLLKDLQESEGQSAGDRYIFIPASILSKVGFFTASIILPTLAYLSIPFIVFSQDGLLSFLSVAVDFLIFLFWLGFSKMVFSELWESTSPDFLEYSPYTFLVGALSFQVVTLPFYHFKLDGTGDIISNIGGFIFLVLALITAFKWRAMKKKLSDRERESLYRPSVWIYIFGFILTNLLAEEFGQRFGAPIAVLVLLNGFFFIALLGRFFGLFKRKKKNLPKIESNT